MALRMNSCYSFGKVFVNREQVFQNLLPFDEGSSFEIFTIVHKEVENVDSVLDVFCFAVKNFTNEHVPSITRHLFECVGGTSSWFPRFVIGVVSSFDDDVFFG